MASVLERDSGQLTNSDAHARRCSVPEARVDERRSPKAEAAGSNPAGDASAPQLNGCPNPAGATICLETLRRSSLLVAEPIADGYLVRPHGQRGSNPRRLLRFRGRSSVGRAGSVAATSSAFDTRTEGRWLSGPGFEPQRLHKFHGDVAQWQGAKHAPSPIFVRQPGEPTVDGYRLERERSRGSNPRRLHR